MKERPILFNGNMVRAILEGRKTMTRRIIKEIPHWEHCGKDIMDWPLSGVYEDNDKFWLDVQTDVDDNSRKEIKCPYGVPGDRLWVRETFCDGYAIGGQDEKGKPINIIYRATEKSNVNDLGWKPSIHMPRWASRITLEITNVRVERVREITPEGAKADGFIDTFGVGACLAFIKTIDKLYPGLWEINGWLWVIEFKVIKC